MKILISDSNVLYRKKLSIILFKEEDVEVQGTASTLNIARKKIELLKPDIFILDGEFLIEENSSLFSSIYSKHPDLTTIITTVDLNGTKNLAEKLIGPAPHDVIQKDNKNFDRCLISSIKKINTRIQFPRKTKEEPARAKIKVPPVKTYIRKRPSLNITRSIVAIGISTGGPKALTVMMPEIPENISTPILIVQHMPPKFTKSLSDSLNTKCKIKVKEAEDGEIIKQGVAYIAPGGKHMDIEELSNGEIGIRIFDGEPVNNCKPAVDVLFYAVAEIYKEKSVGVIMTGMGSDGTKGLRNIKGYGGHVIAQDEESCVVFGMPRAPVEEGLADVISPLENIADEIVKAVGLK